MAAEVHIPTDAETSAKRLAFFRSGSISDSGIAGLIFLFFSLWYWLTRTRYNTFDAVSYANQIGRLYEQTGNNKWLFHPHHLLFNITNYGVWRLARMLGYLGGPLITMERLNSLLGAAGIAVFFLTLRRLSPRSVGISFWTAAGLGFSFGYWVCATDGRVNMPSTFFLLLAFYCIASYRDYPLRRTLYWLSASNALAFLFHESAGLFLLPSVAAVLLLSPAKERVSQTFIFIASWAAAIVLPYAVVAWFFLHLHSLSAVHQWSAEYSELGWWWSFNIPHNLRLDLYALRHAALAEPLGKQGTFSLAPSSSPAERALYWGALAGWLAAVYAFFSAVPSLWRSHHRPLLIVCLLWILVYAAFFTVWSPGYFVFWVPVLAPIGSMLALSMTHYRSGSTGMKVTLLAAAWAILLVATNWCDSIQPHLIPGCNPFQRIALNVKSHTQPGDLILAAGAGEQGQDEVFIPYFANRNVVSLHSLLTEAHNNIPLAVAAAQQEMQQAWSEGHSVYSLDELWQGNQAWNALRKRHPGASPAMLDGWAVREPQPAWFDLYHRPVWLLIPQPPSVDAPATVTSDTSGENP